MVRLREEVSGYIYEERNGDIEVVTALWVDGRRLKTLGFTRI